PAPEAAASTMLRSALYRARLFRKTRCICFLPAAGEVGRSPETSECHRPPLAPLSARAGRRSSGSESRLRCRLGSCCLSYGCSVKLVERPARGAHLPELFGSAAGDLAQALAGAHLRQSHHGNALLLR